MREEVRNLIDQAKKDLEVAEKNLQLKEYYIVAFLCQQSMEKALKACFMVRNQKSAGPTHSLIFLAKGVGVPTSFHSFLGGLTPEFITTRYPDVAGDAPYRLYHEDKVKVYLKKSKELMKWLESQISRP